MKILITGATSGIGFLTGITLAHRNHSVIMTTHTEEQNIELKKKVDKLGLKIDTFKLDITNEEDRNMIKNMDVDVLINHASIGIGGPVIDLEDKLLEDNYNVNVFSTIKLTKIFCNELIKYNKKGKVLFTSSIEFLGSYCSTKASISMLSKCLKKELKKVYPDIKISLIIPGAYKTGFNDVMIDSVFDNIKNTHISFDKKNKIVNSLKKKFNIIESKNINSIVCQIIKAVECGDRFTYSSPFLQRIFMKLYLIIFG